MNPIILMLVAIVFIGVMLLVIIAMTRRSPHGLNQQKYRSEWLKIENSLDKSNIMTYQMAILSADKLLDQALRDIGLPGEAMGDRLKAAKGKFSNINQVWTAHKLRNRIAHDTDVKINIMVAKRALAVFKRSLRELGAI